MYCMKCGKMLGVTHKYCTNCGAPNPKTPLPSSGVVNGSNVGTSYFIVHHPAYWYALYMMKNK